MRDFLSCETGCGIPVGLQIPSLGRDLHPKSASAVRMPAVVVKIDLCQPAFAAEAKRCLS